MYIKQVTIHGFKSYRDQVVIDAFSPRHNVVIGRNGSGKSNFFAAIRFVLGDAYVNMGREERQALLHEGTGSEVISAFVEIIFDNADNRFPTGRDEVIIRRTIGMKKDEYSLDRRSVTKSDIGNLLESAGFSRSNPYYIVPQGRIGALTNAKNEDRLNLLKEVAGTHVYEDKRQESLKILEDTEQKRDKIVELLGFIEERLGQLSKERDELKDFQELDKERRSLEYTIFREEETATMDELNDNMTLYNVKNDEVKHLLQKKVTLDDSVRDSESELRKLRLANDTLQLEKQRLEKEKESLLKTHAKLDVAVRELRLTLANDTEQQQHAAASLARLRDEIAQREQELAQLLPHYQEAAHHEETLTQQLEENESQRDFLFAKQSRASQFKTQAQRNQWLSSEITHLDHLITDIHHRHKTTDSDLQSLRQRTQQHQSALEDAESRAQSTRDTLQTLVRDRLPTLKQTRDTLMAERKEAWREEARLDSAVRAARDTLDAHERTLASTTDKMTALGLAAVRQLSERHGLSGVVFGPLYELFEVDEQLHMATEVTAGASLFHVVVDTDETAARLLELLAAQPHSGRVTFMPLNRLQQRTQPDYPKLDKTFPLLNVLRYDRDKFEPAFQHVFGDTLVCFNLDIAARVAQQYGLHGVTVAGDQVARKGAISGGFHDPRRSRLAAMAGRSAARLEWAAAEAALTAVKQQLTHLDQRITGILSELQGIETERVRAHDTVETCQTLSQRLRRDLITDQETLQLKEKLLLQTAAELVRTERQRAVLVVEQQSPWQRETAGTLSLEEQQQLSALTRTITVLQGELSRAATRRAQLQRDKASLESLLQENLRRRLSDLEHPMTAAATQQQQLKDGGHRLQALLERQEDEWQQVTRDLAFLGESLTALAERWRTQTASVRQGEHDVEDLRIQGQTLDQQRQALTQHAQKVLNRRALLEQKLVACQQRIRELGAIPADAFDKYRDMKTKKLLQTLGQVREALQRYSHVNKKAYEQFVNFTEQRDALLQRQDELDQSKTSIGDLIRVLDQRKEEAIERTFKQVAQYFSETFRELVPAGQAALLMIRRGINDQPRGNREEEEEEEEIGTYLEETMVSPVENTKHSKGNTATANHQKKKKTASIENYVGISIRVTFHQEHEMHVPIDQLSGGQKTVIALALIFAIQRCDPAPFYLFDEIDASLDTVHRTALANLLHSLSDRAQFITTTFRPEMLVHADKFYNVVFANKVSQLDVISRETATQFMEQETAVG